MSEHQTPCQTIHLTPRGEAVKDVCAAVLALIIIPALGILTVAMMLP